ncbi:carboxymuconolactone decarboxylase family protein [Pseudolysobacter antarcticus]|nr:carboxymuconolactone decarboxylase family protein [Pseudolysobacter antarcticus]
MSHFIVHSLDTAPPDSRALLERSKKEWGFIPTLHGILAESAPVLHAYQSLFALGQKSGFTPAEQQVVYLTVSAFHECEYCVAGHTYLARAAKLDEQAIASLRNGTPIADAKLDALRIFTDTVVRERGLAGSDALEEFFAAGYGHAQMLEVVMIIATKTISNYVNHLVHTPKESFMSDPTLGWVAPRNRGQVA